jgi:hypothetical protein
MNINMEAQISADNFQDYLVELMTGQREALWQDPTGATLLQWASGNSNTKMINDQVIGTLLGAEPAALHVQDVNGWTPLLHAVSKSNGTSRHSTVQLLIEMGSNVIETLVDGKNALHILCAYDSSMETFMDLIPYFIEIIDDTDNEGNTALSYAAMNSRNPNVAQQIETLVDLGANVNWINKEGTPLIISAAKCLKTTSNMEGIQMLIGKGADPKAKDGDGNTYDDYFPKPENYTKAIEPGTCTLCYTDKATICSASCGHFIYCQSCLNGPAWAYTKCTTCQKPVGKIIDMTHLLGSSGSGNGEVDGDGIVNISV